MTPPAPAAFEDTLTGRSAQAAELARAARDLIRRLDPDVVEVPWPTWHVTGYGFGPRKYTQHYAYLAVQPDHLNLGFNQGAELDDPEHLLTGTGKSLRYCRIESSAQLDQPAVADLLRAARLHRASTTHSSGGTRPARVGTSTDGS